MSFYLLYAVGASVVLLLIYSLNKWYLVNRSAALANAVSSRLDASDKAAALRQLLEDERWFSVVARELEGETIRGMTEALPLKTAGDWLKKTAVNQLGRSLGRYTGVRFRQVEAPYIYYLVVSDSRLSYLAFEEGRLRLKLSFPLTDLAEAALEPVSYRNVLVYEGTAAGNCNKLTFRQGTQHHTFLFYPSIYRSPFGEYAATDSEQTSLHAFSLDFQEEIQRILVVR